MNNNKCVMGAFVKGMLLVVGCAVIGGYCDKKMTKDGESEKVSVPIKNCYQCNSKTDTQEMCEKNDDDLPKDFKRPCRSEQYPEAVGCRKVLMEVENEWRTVRECAYTGENMDGTKTTGNKGVRLYYYQCDDKDACNSAPYPKPFLFLVFLFVLLGHMIFGSS